MVLKDLSLIDLINLSNTLMEDDLKVSNDYGFSSSIKIKRRELHFCYVYGIGKAILKVVISNPSEPTYQVIF